MPSMKVATSGSAYSVLALSLPTPRKVMVMTPWSPWPVAWKPGTRLTTSAMVCTWASSSAWAFRAVIATGVRCREVVRLVAVTNTSAMGALGFTAVALIPVPLLPTVLSLVAGTVVWIWVCAWALTDAARARTARAIGEIGNVRALRAVGFMLSPIIV